MTLCSPTRSLGEVNTRRATQSAYELDFLVMKIDCVVFDCVSPNCEAGCRTRWLFFFVVCDEHVHGDTPFVVISFTFTICESICFSQIVSLRPWFPLLGIVRALGTTSAIHAFFHISSPFFSVVCASSFKTKHIFFFSLFFLPVRGRINLSIVVNPPGAMCFNIVEDLINTRNLSRHPSSPTSRLLAPQIERFFSKKKKNVRFWKGNFGERQNSGQNKHSLRTLFPWMIHVEKSSLSSKTVHNAISCFRCCMFCNFYFLQKLYCFVLQSAIASTAKPCSYDKAVAA